MSSPSRITNWTLLKFLHHAQALKGSQRHVMNALAIRADIKKGYTCFPSYETLMEDTQLGNTQIREAMRGLEQANFVRRVARPGSSNVFQINVALLKRLAEDKQEEKRRTEKPLLPDLDDPWGTEPEAEDDPDDRDNTDGLEGEAENEAHVRDFFLCRTPAKVLKLVRKFWPEHQVFSDQRGIEFLERDLAACIELAQTSYRCGQILTLIYETNPEASRAVAKSAKLGAYLLKCFPGWIASHADELVSPDYSPEGEQR